MPIPSKTELKEYFASKQKHDKKRVKAQIKKTVEYLSEKILSGRQTITTNLTCQETINGVLEAFQKKGYDIKVNMEQHKARGSKRPDRAKFIFDFSEFE